MSDPTETVTLSSLTQLQREAAERTVARNAGQKRDRIQRTEESA